MDDRELVRRTRAGDGCAFAGLVDRYRNPIYGLAYHLLGNAEDAQDAAQEAFVRAYAQLDSLRHADQVAAWLRRITVHLCADLRRRQNSPLPSWNEAEQASRFRANADWERLATQVQVRQALGCLPEQTRLTVILCYVSGYSHAEVARFLEIPVNTVRSRLLSAKRRLREEMRDMIEDAVNAGKPNAEWTRKVVAEAMRRGEQALRSYENGNALRHYDEALTALDAMTPGAERRRLTMEALRQKAKARHDYAEVIRLYEQALEIAEELGDRFAQAEILVNQGGAFYNSNSGQDDRVEECYQRALSLWREIGDQAQQARCLTNLGTGRLWGDAAQGQPFFAQALALFEAAQDHNGVAYCRAMLDVADAVGPENLRVITGYYAGSDVLRTHEGTISHPSETCHISYTWTDDLNRSPLKVQRVFRQCAHLNTFLDSVVPVGGSWSGPAFSYSQQPLQATVTILSDQERVSVPAGTFGDCLLTEQVTTESALPDDGTEESKEANRRELCGVCRAWYAPGVGLVQVHVTLDGGLEALIQLRDYSVAEAEGEYLPLALGSAWTYGWAGLPPKYEAKEVYRVTGHEDDRWYLEHYAYARRV